MKVLARLASVLRSLWVDVKASALGWHRVDESKIFVSSFVVAYQEMLAVRQVRLDVFRAIQRWKPIAFVRKGESVDLVIENANPFAVTVAMVLVLRGTSGDRVTRYIVPFKPTARVESDGWVLLRCVPDVSGPIDRILVATPKWERKN